MKEKSKIKHYTSPQECADVLKGMLKAKQEWLEYAKKREEELAIS